MKKGIFLKKGRIACLLLACVLLLDLGTGLVLPASAASSDKVIPEMSKFFETDYTQAQMTEYSRLLTCIYDKDEGTAPLEAFLELLQEDRYQLELDSVSDEYPDSYSTATVKDYFFHYTGTSSAIQWIKLKNGTKYHVRVSLYTYAEKDYSAIVYYSHPNFLHRDAGVTYADIKKQETLPTTMPPAPEREPPETTGETEALPVSGGPDLTEYFGASVQTVRKDGRTEYNYEFSQYPVAGMRAFEKYLESIGASESFYEAYENGNILLEYAGNNGIVVSMCWLASANFLNVVLYDQDWERIGKTMPTMTELENRQTVEVQEDAVFRLEKGDKATLKCTYDEGKRDDFSWKILSGKDAVSISKSKNKCKIKGKSQGIAEVEMTYTYVDGQKEKRSIVNTYTIIVE